MRAEYETTDFPPADKKNADSAQTRLIFLHNFMAENTEKPLVLFCQPAESRPPTMSLHRLLT